MVFCFQGLSTAQQPLGRAVLFARQPSCLQPPQLQGSGSSRERRARHAALGAVLQWSWLLSSVPYQRRLEGAGEGGYWTGKKNGEQGWFF